MKCHPFVTVAAGGEGNVTINGRSRKHKLIISLANFSRKICVSTTIIVATIITLTACVGNISPKEVFHV